MFNSVYLPNVGPYVHNTVIVLMTTDLTIIFVYLGWQQWRSGSPAVQTSDTAGDWKLSSVDERWFDKVYTFKTNYQPKTNNLNV